MDTAHLSELLLTNQDETSGNEWFVLFFFFCFFFTSNIIDDDISSAPSLHRPVVKFRHGRHRNDISRRRCRSFSGVFLLWSLFFFFFFFCLWKDSFLCSDHTQHSAALAIRSPASYRVFLKLFYYDFFIFQRFAPGLRYTHTHTHTHTHTQTSKRH